MGNINPTGIMIKAEVEQAERELIFTLNAVDEIQEHFNAPLQDIMERVPDEDGEVLRYTLMIMLNDEAERKPGEQLRKYTEKEIGWIVTLHNKLEFVVRILQAYGVSIPEVEDEDQEEEYPNQKSGSVKR